MSHWLRKPVALTPSIALSLSLPPQKNKIRLSYDECLILPTTFLYLCRSSVVLLLLLLLMLLLLLLGMHAANSNPDPGRRRVVAVAVVATVRGRTLARVAADAAVVAVTITIHARTLIKRVQMLRRRGYPLLLLVVLLNLPDKVTIAAGAAVAIPVATAAAQVDLVGVVVEETLLLLLLLLMLAAAL